MINNNQNNTINNNNNDNVRNDSDDSHDNNMNTDDYTTNGSNVDDNDTNASREIEWRYDGRRLFPNYTSRENRSFMRLLERLGEQQEFQRNYTTPQLQTFLTRYPTYDQFDRNSLLVSYDAVQRYFDRCK